MDGYIKYGNPCTNALIGKHDNDVVNACGNYVPTTTIDGRRDATTESFSVFHIHREVYKQLSPKVEYFLTKIGRTHIPILLSMHEWGG